jgi:hypothetical protein
MKAKLDYHYVVSSIDNTILGIYGKALRELAFESAAKHRNRGVNCEVFTKFGFRQAQGSKFK